MGHVTRYANDGMIYGLDFYIDSIDDNEAHFWLQYENDENRLIVDNFSDIDLGLPAEKHNMTANSSGINAFYGRSEYSERIITLQTYWGKDTDGGIINRRRNFLIDYFTGKSAKLYFYIYIPQKMRRYKVEVKPSITGEKYSNFVIVDGISIKLTCASVFYESEDFISHKETITGNKESFFRVQNDGFETSFVLKIVPTEDFDSFQFANAGGSVFKIRTYSKWTAGSVITVDTGLASVKVNGIEQLNAIERGTFFNLMQGENVLYYQGGKAEIEVLFREKIK